MGWVMMSERELNRVEVLTQVIDERLTAEAAATLLDVTKRQVFRLLRRFRADGPSGIRHKLAGVLRTIGSATPNETTRLR